MNEAIPAANEKSNGSKLDFAKIEAEGYLVYHPVGEKPYGEADYAPASDLVERRKFGEKNKEFVERINTGEKFSVRFSGMEPDDSPLVSIGYNDVSVPGSAFYALVVLDGGMRVPLPIFELGLGERLADQSFVREYEEGEDGMWSAGVACTRTDFENWMKGRFGDQFTGLE